MTWATYHGKSIDYVNRAEKAIKRNDTDSASKFYRMAALAEGIALHKLELTKKRTLGITAVSAASLWYKAHDLRKAQKLSYQALALSGLPDFARQQLQKLLQTIWSEESRMKSGINFTKGEVLISISGGEVVTGGAPLDLILTKVEQVSRMFYRTVEMLLDRPFRLRGNPPADIQEQFRPWLFQTEPGSYQFAVRIEKPKQMELFPTARTEVERITEKFMDIVRASTDDPKGVLPEIVPDIQYRDAFMRLTRNLAPAGKLFSKMEIKSSSVPEMRPIELNQASREIISEAVKKHRVKEKKEQAEEVIQLRGTLRGLQLDHDWLEINEHGEPPRSIRIYEASEAIDDVVGPMVNHNVIVDVARKRTRFVYRDIQMED